MNVETILSMVDSLYPNASTVEEKITFMNIAQNEMSPYFGITAEDSTLKTIIDQDAYDFPTGISDVSQIKTLAIGNSATPLNRYDYLKYILNKENDNPMNGNGYFQIINSLGLKKLTIYPVPIIADLPIVIKYNKQLTELSASDLAFVPEFDSRYHPMLAFYCCHMICTLGSSPDSYQANMFMAKYDNSLSALWKSSMEEDKAKEVVRRDNKQWHRSSSYGRGF